ncbi:MAG: hypothetical protein MPN21_18705, partial [Thermoanaerobaculia bacterium]|nr:hypothetical protein [Thermoanaerobaculia bacterium]
VIRKDGPNVAILDCRVNKLVYRLYCEEKLQVRTRRRRRKIATQPRLELQEAPLVNQRWSMDFVTDQLPMAGVGALA